MNEPYYSSEPHRNDDDNSHEENNVQKKNNAGFLNRPVKFGCSALAALAVVMYFIFVGPGIITRYFTNISTEMAVSALVIVFLLVVVLVLYAVISGNSSGSAPEKDDFTHVSNEYTIRKKYSEKIHSTTEDSKESPNEDDL